MNKKKIIVVFLTVIILIASVVVCHAETIDKIPNKLADSAVVVYLPTGNKDVANSTLPVVGYIFAAQSDKKTQYAVFSTKGFTDIKKDSVLTAGVTTDSAKAIEVTVCGVDETSQTAVIEITQAFKGKKNVGFAELGDGIQCDEYIAVKNNINNNKPSSTSLSSDIFTCEKKDNTSVNYANGKFNVSAETDSYQNGALLLSPDGKFLGIYSGASVGTEPSTDENALIPLSNSVVFSGFSKIGNMLPADVTVSIETITENSGKSSKAILYAILAAVIVIAAAAVMILFFVKKKHKSPIIKTSDTKYIGSGKMNKTRRITHKPIPQNVYVIGADGYFRGKKFMLFDSLNIGTDPNSCDIAYPMDYPKVSGKHCTIYCSDAVYISDDGSAYGTFLEDGRQIMPSEPLKVNNGQRFYVSDRINMFEIRM